MIHSAASMARRKLSTNTFRSRLGGHADDPVDHVAPFARRAGADLDPGKSWVPRWAMMFLMPLCPRRSRWAAPAASPPAMTHRHRSPARGRHTPSANSLSLIHFRIGAKITRLPASAVWSAPGGRSPLPEKNTARCGKSMGFFSSLFVRIFIITNILGKSSISGEFIKRNFLRFFLYSLNLGNSAAIGVFGGALRQQGFPPQGAGEDDRLQ